MNALEFPLPSLPTGDHPAEVATSLHGAPRDAGTVIAVTGLSGAGKTTWLNQFVAHSGRGVVVVSADDVERDLPYALADKLIRAAGHSYGLFGLDGSEPTPLSAARAVLGALSALRVRRLTVVIDDTQWCDEASVGVLRFSLGRLARSGVCAVFAGQAPGTPRVVAAVMAGDPPAWSLERRIAVPSLEGAALRQYLTMNHDVQVSLRTAGRIRDLTGGVPVLVDQLVERMYRTTPDRRWDDGIEFPFVPDNPFAGVAADVSADAIDVVEIASELWDPLPRNQLERILQAVSPRTHAPRAVDAALEAGLLASGDGQLSPFHDLFARDIREHLDPERRLEILDAAAAQFDDVHRALRCRLDAASQRREGLSAPLLAEVRLAAHTAADTRHSERAVNYLCDAAEIAAVTDFKLSNELVVEACVIAASVMASPLVVGLIPRLEAMDPDPVRDLALLQTLRISGNTDRALEVALELRDAPPTERQHPDARFLRAHAAVLGIAVQLNAGDFAPMWGWLNYARECVGDLLANPAPIVDERLMKLESAQALQLRCNNNAFFIATALHQPEIVAAELAGIEELLGPAGSTPDPTRLGLLEGTTAYLETLAIRASAAFGHGRIKDAAADYVHVLELARQGVEAWGLGHNRVIAALSAWILGDVAQADAILDDTEASLLDSPNVLARPLVYTFKALFAAARGDSEGYTRALVQKENVDAGKFGFGDLGAAPEALYVIEHALAQHGPTPEAAHIILEALSPEALGTRWIGSSDVFGYRVEALAILGQAEEADRELERLRALDGLKDGTGFFPRYLSLEWLEGRVAEAYGLTEQALHHYRKAVTVGYPACQARAMFDAGRLTLESGGSKEIARRWLHDAAAEFERLGRTPSLERTQALLRPTSLSDRALEPTVLRALTEREAEIAELAASGKTNPEIAEILSLSRATVAFHIRAVLAKLELTSRRQLHDALR